MKKSRIVFVVAAFAAVIGFMINLGRPSEPRSGGRTLSEWVKEVATGAEMKEAAIRHLGAMGTNALPGLVKILRARDDSVAKNALIHSLNQSWRVRLNLISANEWHDAAAMTFSRLGSSAKAALPDLTNACEDKRARVRYLALYAMINIGLEKEHTALLIKVLRDSDFGVRDQAINALGRIELDQSVAIPPMIAMLKENSWRCRRDAATALGQIGPAAKEAVPALLKNLKDEDKRVRDEALMALAMIEPDVAAKIGVQ